MPTEHYSELHKHLVVISITFILGIFSSCLHVVYPLSAQSCACNLISDAWCPYFVILPRTNLVTCMTYRQRVAVSPQLTRVLVQMR